MSDSNDSHPWESKFVIVRTYAAGVHFGILKSYDAKTRHIYLMNSRRIWQWEGAFTLSAVATDGITGGRLSKFIPEIMIGDVIEIIPCSGKATASLLEFAEHKP